MIEWLKALWGGKQDVVEQEREYRIREWYDEDDRQVLFCAQYNDGKEWCNLNASSSISKDTIMLYIAWDYTHRQKLKASKTEYHPVDVTTLPEINDSSRLKWSSLVGPFDEDE